MIRDATSADVAPMVEMGQLFHEESPQWSRLVYDGARVERALHGLVESEHGLLLVAEQNGAIVGGIAASACPHWSSKDFVAHELALFVQPECRGSTHAFRLIRAMEHWAYGLGCVMMLAGCSTGIDDERNVALYEALGFRRSSVGVERWFGRE